MDRPHEWGQSEDQRERRQEREQRGDRSPSEPCLQRGVGHGLPAGHEADERHHENQRARRGLAHRQGREPFVGGEPAAGHRLVERPGHDGIRTTERQQRGGGKQPGDRVPPATGCMRRSHTPEACGPDRRRHTRHHDEMPHAARKTLARRKLVSFHPRAGFHHRSQQQSTKHARRQHDHRKRHTGRQCSDRCAEDRDGRCRRERLPSNPPGREGHDHHDRGPRARKGSGNERPRSAGRMQPGQHHHERCSRQHEERAGGEPTGETAATPAGVGRQLLRLGAGEEHAHPERRQKLILIEPAAAFDQFAVEDRHLAGGPAEADRADHEPRPPVARHDTRYPAQSHGW